MSDTSGDGSVRITQREVYNLVLEVRDGVRDLVTRDGEADKIHADHEVRLRKLERLAYKVLGAVALVTFVLGFAGYFLLTQLVHK